MVESSEVGAVKRCGRAVVGANDHHRRCSMFVFTWTICRLLLASAHAWLQAKFESCAAPSLTGLCWCSFAMAGERGKGG